VGFGSARAEKAQGLLWVKVRSPGAQPASRLTSNSGHGLPPRKLTLCAKTGSYPTSHNCVSNNALIVSTGVACNVRP
jgi:hypothetical protein